MKMLKLQWKEVIKLGPEQKQKHKNKQGRPVYDLRSW